MAKNNRMDQSNCTKLVGESLPGEVRNVNNGPPIVALELSILLTPVVKKPLRNIGMTFAAEDHPLRNWDLSLAKLGRAMLANEPVVTIILQPGLGPFCIEGTF